MFDEEQREQEVIDFISNKIKRCRKCGNELHYKEKYYFTDRICCVCKGLKPFDAPEDVSPYKNCEPEPARLADEGHNARTFTERELFKRYPEWQLMNERAAKKWHEDHPAEEKNLPSSQSAVNSAGLLSVERINELMAKYDASEAVNIRQEELISLLWEVLYHRDINTIF